MGKIAQVIEFGRVMDIYPDYGCTQLRVKGERTGIEYVQCICHLRGHCPAVYGRVIVEHGPKCEGRSTHVFSTEGLLDDVDDILLASIQGIAESP